MCEKNYQSKIIELESRYRHENKKLTNEINFHKNKTSELKKAFESLTFTNEQNIHLLNEASSYSKTLIDAFLNESDNCE